MGRVGLEPTRTQSPAVFKTAASAYSAIAPVSMILTEEEKLSRNENARDRQFEVLWFRMFSLLSSNRNLTHFL